ncbi:hypothetical protein OG393_10405 [Streptomyces sp. NBC_01216]|uniref:hypothetical protein n=1 Tax=Streptomyces sp. NBC_01216 TaxID=2903778 RepID=UPI002E1340AA|nr:hypothetical protein OG393_10405 [Streptomyces sp. NBC_01216]
MADRVPRDTTPAPLPRRGCVRMAADARAARRAARPALLAAALVAVDSGRHRAAGPVLMPVPSVPKSGPGV